MSSCLVKDNICISVIHNALNRVIHVILVRVIQAAEPLQSVRLHCALSLAAQCIVIGPVCGFVCVCVCVCVFVFVGLLLR